MEWPHIRRGAVGVLGGGGIPGIDGGRPRLETPVEGVRVGEGGIRIQIAVDPIRIDFSFVNISNNNSLIWTAENLSPCFSAR